MEKIETNNLSDIARVAHQIGDKLANKFNESEDLKVAQLTFKAYTLVVNVKKTQVIVKKLTGEPKQIEGIE